MTDSSSLRNPGGRSETAAFVFPALVEAPHIEAEYRHVHHADVLKFFERARLEFMKGIGFPNQMFIERDLFLVLTRVEVSYLRELLEGPIEVSVENPRLLEDGRTLVLNQQLLRVTKLRRKLAAEATISSVFMSGATKRAVLPPPEFLAALGIASRP